MLEEEEEAEDSYSTKLLGLGETLRRSSLRIFTQLLLTVDRK